MDLCVPRFDQAGFGGDVNHLRPKWISGQGLMDSGRGYKLRQIPFHIALLGAVTMQCRETGCIGHLQTFVTCAAGTEVDTKADGRLNVPRLFI